MRSTQVIEGQVRVLFETVLGSTDRDSITIVPVERKGTAVLRSLIESGELELKWQQIVSDAALDLLPHGFFGGKRVLLFNEMVHHGHNTEQALGKLRAKGVSESDVEVVALAVHTDCPTSARPDHFLYGWLSDERYEAKRSELVAMLQRHGSLLLDTEHVEVTVRLHCSVREFFEAVASCGSAIEFRSAGRHNLTVYDPVDASDEDALAVISPDSLLDGVVKKGRVVQRGPDPNVFAVIGIWYPTTRSHAGKDMRFRFRDELRFLDELASTPLGAFYATGLVSGLQVLRAMMAPVRGLGDKVTILGAPTGRSVDGSPLDHLLALYPPLGADGIQHLRHYMAALQATRQGSREGGQLERCGEAELEDAKNRLAREMLIATEAIRDLASVTGSQCRPLGLSNREVFDIAERECGLGKGRASAALDGLIDDATVVTRVEPSRGRHDSEHCMRTFEPDGEIVAAQLRRLIAVKGRGRPRC
jgi:hypothetical protein